MPRSSPPHYSGSSSDKRSVDSHGSSRRDRSYDYEYSDRERDKRRNYDRSSFYEDRRRRRSRSRSQSRSRSRSRSKSLSPPNNKSNNRITAPGIQMKLACPPVNTSTATSKIAPLTSPLPAKPATKLKVASIFNEDDDDEPEEMPAECRMRMKNVGRETPTSAGPNSFGKTKIGFCNVSHIAEKKGHM